MVISKQMCHSEWSGLHPNAQKISISLQRVGIMKLDKNEVSDKQSEKRRRLIKSLTAGGAAVTVIPSRWTSPIVDSIVVPSHAELTAGGGGPGAGVDPCASPGSGMSNTPGLTANITAALIDGDGDLIVVGETDLPEVCFVLGEDEDSVAVTCQVLDCNANVLGFNFTPTLGSFEKSHNCASAGQDCLISCSVEVDAGAHSVVSGDAVTLRFSFSKGCIVSAVATIP